jgi:hypothetical protein
MSIVMPMGSPSNLKFEEYQIHEKLFIIREVNKKSVIGYVNQDPIENGWFWFVMNDISKTFNDKDDAIEDLIQTFLTIKFKKLYSKSKQIIKI